MTKDCGGEEMDGIVKTILTQKRTWPSLTHTGFLLGYYDCVVVIYQHVRVPLESRTCSCYNQRHHSYYVVSQLGVTGCADARSILSCCLQYYVLCVKVWLVVSMRHSTWKTCMRQRRRGQIIKFSGSTNKTIYRFQKCWFFLFMSLSETIMYLSTRNIEVLGPVVFVVSVGIFGGEAVFYSMNVHWVIRYSANVVASMTNEFEQGTGILVYSTFSTNATVRNIWNIFLWTNDIFRLNSLPNIRDCAQGVGSST